MQYRCICTIIILRYKGEKQRQQMLGKENAMEEREIFKGYLRGLMRQLKLLKETIGNNDLEQAERLVDELIEDTQKNIED